MANDRSEQTSDEAGGEDLSRIYAEVSGVEPPAGLDALILSAARNELEPPAPEAASVKPGQPGLPRAPWAMAALVVLAAMLYQVIPDQQMTGSEPIVVSMADRQAHDFSDLQNKLKETPAAPAPDASPRIGSVSSGADFRQERSVPERKQTEERAVLEAREADESLAPEPVIVARSTKASAPEKSEQFVAEAESKAAPIASLPQVAMVDRDVQQAPRSNLQRHASGRLLENRKRATRTTVTESTQAYSAPGSLAGDAQLAAPQSRKDDAAEFATLADSAAVAGARADAPDQLAAAPAEVAAGQVLIFAGAPDSGIFVEQAGQFDGLGVELARRVLNQAGYRVEFRAMPLNEAVEQARSGAVDAVIGVAISIGADRSLQSGSEAFSPDGLVFAFSELRSLGELRAHFDAEIARMRASGELANLQRRYGVHSGLQ